MVNGDVVGVPHMASIRVGWMAPAVFDRAAVATDGCRHTGRRHTPAPRRVNIAGRITEAAELGQRPMPMELVCDEQVERAQLLRSSNFDVEN